MPRTCAVHAMGLPGAGRRHAPREGYALIELMLALLIVSLLAGLALPRPSTTGSVGELRATASRIAVLLRADRNAALRSGLAIVSAVDPGAGSVRSGSGAAGIVLVRPYRLLTSGTLAGGIRFDPDGHAQGGEIALINEREQHVVIRIDPVSAAIEVRDGEARHGR